MGLDYAERQTPAAFPQPAADSQFPAPPAAGVTLQPGMVLEIHTGIGQEAAGFGYIGDVYLVTERGHERLTKFPQDLFIA